MDLIGDDVAGKLLTGRKVELQSGPVAFETLLGWSPLNKAKHITLTTNSQTDKVV